MFLAEFGTWQMIIVLVVIVLLFGASRIPDTMKNLGKGVSEFKKGLREGEEETRKAVEAKNDESAKKSS
ncbi:MAG: twin-arginine translocase TatA/TatE family subunit [Planctomycetota bacterium]